MRRSDSGMWSNPGSSSPNTGFASLRAGCVMMCSWGPFGWCASPGRVNLWIGCERFLLAPWRRRVGEHAAGHLGRGREFHVPGGEGMLDEGGQCLGAPGTPGQESVAGQDEQAVIAAHRVKLTPPHRGGLGRRLDVRADVRLWQIGVLLPVVQ